MQQKTPALNQEHNNRLRTDKQQLQTKVAKQANDLSVLLRPWCSYRLYIRFSKPNFDSRTGEKLTSNHFYGYEHSVSYRQCTHGHVAFILLDKLKGYTECINMAEEKFKGKYLFATIYGRVLLPNGKFDVVHRHYNKAGELENVQDPVLTDADNRLLYFEMINHFLEIKTEPPAVIDFKKEVEEKLK